MSAISEPDPEPAHISIDTFDALTAQIEKDLAYGVVITRHNADGTFERIDPEDFYAKPDDGKQQ